MNFKEQWDRMTVVERIAHIRSDWQSCQHTHDPVVRRIAVAVAHDVCRQAADEIERLIAERDEARRETCKFESKVDWDHGNTDPARFGPMALAAERGWDCFKGDGK